MQGKPYAPAEPRPFSKSALVHALTLRGAVQASRLWLDRCQIKNIAPGLGVRLDRDKFAEYYELYRKLGSYPYYQDPLRPGWTPLIPNGRWADPADERVPEIPF